MDAEVAVKGDLGRLWARLWMLAMISANSLVDFAFLAGWVWLQRYSNEAFDWLGERPGMTTVKRQIVEYVFDGATLTLLVAYTARDLYLSIRRIWRSR